MHNHQADSSLDMAVLSDLVICKECDTMYDIECPYGD